MGRKSIASLRTQKVDTKVDDDSEETIVKENTSKADEDEDENENAEEDDDAEKNKRKRVRKRKAASDPKQEDDEPVAAGNDRFNNECTIYMEGLPFEATEESITAFFAVVGPLVGLRLPRWHDSGRLRGYGHAEFATADEARQAMEKLNGAYMGKRYIKLDRPMTPRIVQQQQLSAEAVGADGKKAKLTRPAGCRTVFVKNLPYECEEKDVMDAFMVCGKIAKVRLAVWNHTGKLKGFGYVDFKSEDSAEIAVNKCVYGGGVNVKGRPVVCDFEMGQAKGSFKPLGASK